MGVTLLQSLTVPPDKTAPQLIDLFSKRILSLGAVKTGPFLVDCETYTSTSNLQSSLQGPAGKFGKTFHVLHNSEHPATVFTVLEPPPPVGPQQQQQPAKQKLTFTSDTLFDLLLLKLEKFYQKRLKIESKGSRFELGDFVVKLGIVTAAATVKGVLVEVEYLPCVGINACWELINEFAQGFIGSEVSSQNRANYLNEKNPNEVYTPADTIHQYLEHFVTFRKTGLTSQQQQQQGATPQR